MRLSCATLALCLVSCIKCQVLSSSADACNIPLLVPYAFQELCRPGDVELSPIQAVQKQGAERFSRFTSTRLIQSSWNWTYEPLCAYSKAGSTNVCVYTDITFSSGRGISIIVTPEGAKHLRTLKALHSKGARTLQGFAHYDLKSLPGRGVGAVANSVLRRGDSLMSPSPVLLLQANVERYLEKEDLLELTRVAVERMPEGTKNLFMALHAHFDKEDPIYERIETNGIRIFDFIGVVPELARLNHDCRPK